MIWLKTQEEQERCAKSCFEGMVLSHPDRWELLPTDTSGGILVRKKLPEARFGVIVSGGAGNGPLFAGYVGDCLADAAVAGGAYAAPNAYALYEAGKRLGRDRDILLLYNRFAGDYLNNDMAQELLEMDGIRTASVMATDDIATAVGCGRDQRNGRCGVALLIRLAAFCRNEGMGLEQTAALLRRANEGLTTISVHVDLEKGRAVFGGGFSGEPGILAREDLDKPALVRTAVDMLLADLPPKPEEKLILLVNRLRLTSFPDGYITAKLAYEYLALKHPVYKLCVGGFSNIADVFGWDFSLLRVDAVGAAAFAEAARGDGFQL